MAKCLECNTELNIDKDFQVGEIIECSNCGVELELVSTSPLELSIFEEEEK